MSAYNDWLRQMQEMQQKNAAAQATVPITPQLPPVPTSLFDPNQYSKFGNMMARGGGFGPYMNPGVQNQITTPADLEAYNQARLAARNKGLGQMMYALSDAFAGRDIGKGVMERQIGPMGLVKPTADIQNYQYYMSLDEKGKKAWRENKNLDPALRYLIKEQERIAGSTAGLDLTDYQRKTDEAFATEAVEFESTEKWTAISNLDKLDQSIAALKESDNLTGPVIGNTPRVVLAITNPEAVGLEDDIRSIIFQSLRATLGAQFTEREGDRLVAASFNQLLPEEVNMKRLERLRTETFNSIKSKEDKIAYLKKEGTLRGYEGEQSVDSLINAIIKPEDYAGLSDDQLMTIFKDPNTSEAELNAIRKLIGG